MRVKCSGDLTSWQRRVTPTLDEALQVVLGHWRPPNSAAVTPSSQVPASLNTYTAVPTQFTSWSPMFTMPGSQNPVRLSRQTTGPNSRPARENSRPPAANHDSAMWDTGLTSFSTSRGLFQQVLTNHQHSMASRHQAALHEIGCAIGHAPETTPTAETTSSGSMAANNATGNRTFKNSQSGVLAAENVARVPSSAAKSNVSTGNGTLGANCNLPARREVNTVANELPSRNVSGGVVPADNTSTTAKSHQTTDKIVTGNGTVGVRAAGNAPTCSLLTGNEGGCSTALSSTGRDTAGNRALDRTAVNLAVCGNESPGELPDAATINALVGHRGAVPDTGGGSMALSSTRKNTAGNTTLDRTAVNQAAGKSPHGGTAACSVGNGGAVADVVEGGVLGGPARSETRENYAAETGTGKTESENASTSGTGVRNASVVSLSDSLDAAGSSVDRLERTRGRDDLGRVDGGNVTAVNSVVSETAPVRADAKHSVHNGEM